MYSLFFFERATLLRKRNLKLHKTPVHLCFQTVNHNALCPRWANLFRLPMAIKMTVLPDPPGFPCLSSFSISFLFLHFGKERVSGCPQVVLIFLQIIQGHFLTFLFDCLSGSWCSVWACKSSIGVPWELVWDAESQTLPTPTR